MLNSPTSKRIPKPDAQYEYHFHLRPESEGPVTQTDGNQANRIIAPYNHRRIGKSTVAQALISWASQVSSLPVDADGDTRPCSAGIQSCHQTPSGTDDLLPILNQPGRCCDAHRLSANRPRACWCIRSLQDFFEAKILTSLIFASEKTAMASA